MNKVDVPQPEVLPYRLGIVKQRLPPEVDFFRLFDVQYTPLQDEPKGRTKGHTVLVPDAWFVYMKKLMTTVAYDWWRHPGSLNFNKHYVNDGTPTPGKDRPYCENITMGCNFIAFDKMTETHGRVVSRSNKFDPRLLDPAKNNWYFEPHLFWKATAHNVQGKVINVGAGLNVYHPAIKNRPEQWLILEPYVELFPRLPLTVTVDGKKITVTGYILRGASVIGRTLEAGDIYLLQARVPGERVFTTPEFRLDTVSVIPPLGSSPPPAAAVKPGVTSGNAAPMRMA